MSGRIQAPHGSPSSNGHSAPSGAPNPHGSDPLAQDSCSPSTAGPSLPSVFIIRSSLFHPELVSIYATDRPNSPPLYSFKTSRSNPYVVMFQADGPSPIGEASSLSPRREVSMSLRGQQVEVKKGDAGDKFTIEGLLGTFKWRTGSVEGSVWDLVNASGRTLARYVSPEIPRLGKGSLELCVPCDLPFLELALFSMMATRTLKERNMSLGRKVFQAAMGNYSGFGGNASLGDGGGGGDCGGGDGGGGGGAC